MYGLTSNSLVVGESLGSCSASDERQARRRGRLATRRGRRATRRGRSVAVAAVDYRAATAVV